MVTVQSPDILVPPMGFMVEVLNWDSKASSSSASTLASRLSCTSTTNIVLPYSASTLGTEGHELHPLPRGCKALPGGLELTGAFVVSHNLTHSITPLPSSCFGSRLLQEAELEGGIILGQRKRQVSKAGAGQQGKRAGVQAGGEIGQGATKAAVHMRRRPQERQSGDEEATMETNEHDAVIHKLNRGEQSTRPVDTAEPRAMSRRSASVAAKTGKEPPASKSSAGQPRGAEVMKAAALRWGVAARRVRSGPTMSKRCVVTTAAAAVRLPGWLGPPDGASSVSFCHVTYRQQNKDTLHDAVL
ncbi:MAG: hypothetical protein FRX49_06770 [Trebouxia sp. A1-2]|nr:MAG: hypothetical protein FRX49_06770 [Trebouxia sp. A1-2]